MLKWIAEITKKVLINVITFGIIAGALWFLIIRKLF